ncbi:hypothetical protein MQE23_08605 [Streptomyces sp. HP-A2021]|uniref:hypothetical protein n=1 Tax=Streptomyces sp. HP-A2021 TaxID=2927875 RepID=UPI001FAECD75|nr:hypothetical protein [Streptomyces sp. HP-A2021]UOB09112.1 hypothetical protein MQE23_08605 [Streptomyces sp. HP-A2021]
MIPYLILTGTLAASAGWWAGHRTARIRIVFVPTGPPAPLHDGVVAVAMAGWCCDAWAATAGTDHDPTCPRKTPRSSTA